MGQTRAACDLPCPASDVNRLQYSSLRRGSESVERFVIIAPLILIRLEL